jgi:type IV secretion system protein TrbI
MITRGATDGNAELIPVEPAGQADRLANPRLGARPAIHSNVAQADAAATPTPEEQARAAAYARQQEALMAPTSTRQGYSSGWTSDTGRGNSDGRSAAEGVAALANSIAGRDQSASARPENILAGLAGQGAGRASEYDEQNMQARKKQFLTEAGVAKADDYLRSIRTAPLSAFEVKAGWEIPAVMEQALNSDLPGEIKALVSSNVFDTATGQFLLIPQGARLVGNYDSRVGYGQDRVQVVWNRNIFPDASSIDLGGMAGLDSHGNAGLRYQVDHHYKRLVGFAALTSLFSGAFELSQSHRQSVLAYPSVGEIAGSAVGQEISQLGSQITRRNLNVQPTIKIPVGYKFNVRVNRDILFEAPYLPLRAAQTR